MESTQYRIGNFIQGERLSDVTTVWHIDTNGVNGIVDMNDSNAIEYDEVKPIPLTEEWLIKFGFEKMDFMMSGCAVYQQGKSLFRLANKVKPDKESYFSLWHERVSPPTWCLVREINYVHEVQNLYFALTGEELTIK